LGQEASWKEGAAIKLPPRALGQSGTVHIGSGYHSALDDSKILSTPIPPPPVFEPDMTVVSEQATATVTEGPLPLRDSHGWHSQIQKLLNADEVREQKQHASPYPLSWDAPIFQSVFEKRRLRLLNALFRCLNRCGMRPHVSGKEGRDLSITVGDTNVPLTLDSCNATKLIERV
jgi:hypothetical protein